MSTTEISPLVRDLRAALGSDRVLHAPEDLLTYEYDASIDRAVPDVVVLPTTTEQVAAAVRIATEHGVPVVPRGSGTGFAGGALAVQGGVLVALTGMNQIREIDAENRTATVEPGLINLQLQEALAPLGLEYAPDPSSQRI
jgi:FAD/FMN-containing dehydrogenase